jgi:hypothetical protein
MLMQNNQNSWWLSASPHTPNCVMLWGYLIEERNELSIPKCDCALHVMVDYCFYIVVDK